MTARLPENLRERVASFSEYKMGAHRVALVMRDGSLIENVVIAWGNEIVRVGDVDGFQVDVANVVDVQNRL